MGQFLYDRGRAIEVDDRTLAHIQVVVVNKLRRQEHFAITLNDNEQTLCMWVGPQTPMQFVYSGNRRPLLNRLWLEQLADAANSTSGLVLLPEPAYELAPEPARLPESA
jgi:hypothetical protein